MTARSRRLICVAAGVTVFLCTACTYATTPITATDIAPHEVEEVSAVVDGATVQHPIYIFRSTYKPGPPILLLHELPGLSPKTKQYASELTREFTVYAPRLFGADNMYSTPRGFLAYAFNGEWSERASLNGSRRITQWLREAVRWIEARHPGAPIGIIGMCLTGALPLALADHPQVHALVIAQPTLPLIGGREDFGISADEWKIAKQKIQNGAAKVYGVRFIHDSIAKRGKHCRLKRELGDGFVDAEINDKEYVVRDDNGVVLYTVPERAHSTLILEWRPDLTTHPSTKRHRQVELFLRDPASFSRNSQAGCDDTE